jgi:hypothetical protein
VQAFLGSTLENLGGKRVALLRADSGFSDNDFLDHVEGKGLKYIIAHNLKYKLNIRWY